MTTHTDESKLEDLSVHELRPGLGPGHRARGSEVPMGSAPRYAGCGRGREDPLEVFRAFVGMTYLTRVSEGR